MPATRPICYSIVLDRRAVADQLALDVQLFPQRAVLGRQRLLPLHLVNDAAELLGDGDGELQILGVQRLVRIGAVQVDQPQHAVAEAASGRRSGWSRPGRVRLSRLRR